MPHFDKRTIHQATRADPCDLRTNDGVLVEVGMVAYCVRTCDAGRTWYVTEEKITAIRYGGVEVAGEPGRFHMLMWGYNAFHSTRESAESQAARQTKPADNESIWGE